MLELVKTVVLVEVVEEEMELLRVLEQRKKDLMVVMEHLEAVV
jgi:hypothetical protein